MNPRLIVVSALALAALSLSGCESSSGTDELQQLQGTGVAPTTTAPLTNAQKIQAEKDVQAQGEALLAKLASLNLHTTAGVPNSFLLPGGRKDSYGVPMECSIDDIYVGTGAAQYGSESMVLVAPDGNTAVRVSYFNNTDKAACLETVQKTLGW